MTDTRIYAVAGAKGGVGKTTTSINLGTAIATRGARTVVVELDLAMANLVDFLDFETELDDAPTVHDVLAGRASVTQAVRTAPGGLDVVPSGVDLAGFTAATVEGLPALLEPLLDEYDRIVLDTGAGLSRETVVPLGLADEVILVSTPRVAAVRDVEKTRRLAERVDTDVGGIVFTKSGTGRAPPPPELADFLDVELLGHVPEDAAVPDSQDVGKPVVLNASDSEAATAYQRIATTLDKRAVQAGSDGDRTLELPRLDAFDDRTAAEGPAATDTEADPTETDTSTPADTETEPDERAFGVDDGGPETTRAVTATGMVSREGRVPSVGPGMDADSGRDATGSATASDGGTVDTTLDEAEASQESNPTVSGTLDDERDEEEDDGASLRDRAKSLFGL